MPDFSFFLEPPERTVRGLLTVEALAPLSMVAAQPGYYYRSNPAPTDAMLYGLLENALGWHFGAAERKSVLKALQKQAKRLHRKSEWRNDPWLTDAPEGSDSGYTPLLSHHIVFDGVRDLPPVESYDDLWARQAHRDDDFWGGSRHYDAGLEPLVTLLKSKEVKLTSKGEATHATLEQVDSGVAPGDTVFQTAMKARFPYYFVSPTPREYVVPQGPYRFVASTTSAVSDLVSAALDDPAAPLYLGSNDGWVEARWEVL